MSDAFEKRRQIANNTNVLSLQATLLRQKAVIDISDKFIEFHKALSI